MFGKERKWFGKVGKESGKQRLIFRLQFILIFFSNY